MCECVYKLHCEIHYIMSHHFNVCYTLMMTNTHTSSNDCISNAIYLNMCIFRFASLCTSLKVCQISLFYIIYIQQYSVYIYIYIYIYMWEIVIARFLCFFYVLFICMYLYACVVQCTCYDVIPTM